MARWRKRVRLEDGPKLDLNRLIREGLAKSGERRRRDHFVELQCNGEGNSVRPFHVGIILAAPRLDAA